MADAVADHVCLGIRFVLAELELVGFDVVVDLPAPDRVERSDEGELAPADADLGWRPRQGELGAPAEQVDEGGLDAVVGVVAEDDLPAAPAAAEVGEELVPGVARGRFDREFLLLG